MVLALAATAACERKPAIESAPGGLGIPTRAAALGDMPDNAMVGNIPADTPYALVSFRPFPLDFIQKFTKLGTPIWRKALAELPHSDDADKEAFRQDMVWALDHLDVATIEAQGFTTKPRMAVYGLGVYPVIRVEITDGEKVFALVQRLAARWHAPLPAPVAHAGGRYWRIDESEASIVIAVLAKEVVLAVAPKDAIDGQLAQILGEQKPAQAMTTAQFRAIAERDGFTGLGVGFADVVRIAALVAKQSPSPACSEAIAGLARRVPRFALGYGEATASRMSFGMIVELAPDVLGEARGLVGKIAGLDQLLTSKPAMAFAAAIDVEKARVAGGHAAAVLADLGQRCELGSFGTDMQKAVASLARPLPPFVGGVHGGYAVVDKITIGQHGPEGIEGLGSLQVENAGEVIKLAQMKLKTLDLPTDGKAHALPQDVAPLKAFAAANDHAISFAVGPKADGDATRGLGGKPVDAPLVVVAFDYAQLGKFLPMSAMAGNPALRDDMVKMFDALGRLVMQLVVDDRGLVFWMSTDMN